MEAESYGSNSCPRWLLLATAYFFSLCPALAIVLLSVAIMRILRGEVAGLAEAGGFGQAPEIALLLALGVLVTLATFRIRRALEGMQKANRRYQLALESAADGIVMADASGRFLEANAAAAEMLGYDRARLLDLKLEDLSADPDPEFAGSCVREVLAGERSLWECWLRQQTGVLMPVELSASRLEDDRIMVIIRDVTVRNQAEEAVRASLAEKDMLLKEVHHRVKNNLQIISSLLSLQAQRLRDPSLLATFRESQNRINSIALLHEGLYQSRDLARIDFGAYLQKLAQQLSSVFGTDCSGVQLRVYVEPVTLGLDQAVPCALVVNEMVSNAFKHAFPNGDGGEIYVVLRSGSEGRITVTVRDTGVGLPEGVGVGASHSLGLQLLATLARQLRGSIEHSTGRGTEFRLSFSGTVS